MRLPASSDTRLLLAGVAAFLALLLYLAVAFATTHALSSASAPSAGDPFAPFATSNSKFALVSARPGRGLAFRVTPVGPGNYGALVQTLGSNPAPGGRYIVSVWLKGSRPGQIGFELNEFRPGVARYPIETTVPATAHWHHYRFSTRVKGTWLGLATYLYRPAKRDVRTWFAVRDLTLKGEG